MSSKEILKLQEISEVSKYSDGIMYTAITYCYSLLHRHLRGTTVLELGPAEGVMTEHLVASGKNITVVEGSALFCNQLRHRFSSVEVVHSLFEEFQPTRKFDNIVLGHVLEHVQDPVDVLRNVMTWLAPKGCVFAAVPNARSVHRQAAVIMGILQVEDALNEMDLHHGHRRVFNPESFRAAFLNAGFCIDVFGGYWLKPLSNGQLESHWTPAMLNAFMQMGERYPDIAGEMYIVASNHDAKDVG
jgi:2-polyprenyl-3-methyl-5-hydroxy-6-metoxy-1,4-benzoquinol methylase